MISLSMVWVENNLNKKLTKLNLNILLIMYSTTSALKQREKFRLAYAKEEEISH